MVLSDDIVSSLNVWYQNMSISDLNPELPLNSFMNMNTCLDIDVSSLIAPMSIERDRYALA